MLEVGAGGDCLDIFSLVYHFSLLSPSLWKTARYRLKYCLKGPLSPKQPTNHRANSSPVGARFIQRSVGFIGVYIILIIFEKKKLENCVCKTRMMSPCSDCHKILHFPKAEHCLSQTQSIMKTARATDYTNSVSCNARHLQKMTKFKRPYFCQNQLHLNQKAAC